MPNLSVIDYDWNFFDSSQCQVSDCWNVSRARSASSDGGEDPRSDGRLHFVVVTDVELHGAVVPLKIDVTDDGCGVLVLRLPVDLYLLETIAVRYPTWNRLTLIGREHISEARKGVAVFRGHDRIVG